MVQCIAKKQKRAKQTIVYPAWLILWLYRGFHKQNMAIVCKNPKKKQVEFNTACPLPDLDKVWVVYGSRTKLEISQFYAQLIVTTHWPSLDTEL